MTKDEWLQLRCPNDPAVTGCAWCGKGPVRNNLDGEDLCGPCTDLWVRGEGAEARRQDHQTTGAEPRAEARLCGEPQQGWIEWTGGECPVDDPDALVECLFGDGSQDVNEAGIWDWNSKRSPIIAYRLSTSPEQGGGK